MNNKEIVAKALHDVLNEELTMDQIEQLLENPNLLIMEMLLFQPFH